MTKHLDTPIKKKAAARLQFIEKKKPGVAQGGRLQPDALDLRGFRTLAADKKPRRLMGRGRTDLLASASKAERQALIAVLMALRTTDATRFTLIVDPGSDTARCLPQTSPATDDVPREETEFAAAMAAALERGRTSTARILSGPEMRTSDQFAALLGVSRETVNRLRMRHELLGLQGAKRGFKYPDWQITDGAPLKGLPQLHALLQDSPWAVYRFLLEEHDSLGGRRALDLLKKGRLELVLKAAEALNWGTG